MALLKEHTYSSYFATLTAGNLPARIKEIESEFRGMDPKPKRSAARYFFR